MKKYDFSGWATKANLKCSDGLTIMKDAFKHDDGRTVPMVWNHDHNDPLNVLGHAILENRDEGVYVYGVFNDTEAGKAAKLVVEHGDVSALSIWANGLKKNGLNVMHGVIKEVSLVLAGANPGAFIDSVISHGEESDEEAIIYTGEDLELFHAEEEKKDPEEKPNDDISDENVDLFHAEDPNEETVADIFATLSPKQQTVVCALIGQVLEDDNNDSKGGNDDMKQNVFDKDKEDPKDILSHSDIDGIFEEAKQSGSLRKSVLAHGITNIDYLFPDAKNVTNTPTMITREMGWVQKVMSSVHHTPFSRIKSTLANITEDEARAKGYIKGNLKTEEVFSLLKRTTSPTTVYKKQALDRDDMIDITDFDAVAWLKAEMRLMLDEEFARSYLIGDGRPTSSNDKIKEDNIRPIWKDDALYSIKIPVDIAPATTDEQRTKAMIRAAIKSRKNYKGSGEPSLYATEDFVTDCLLLEDNMGRLLYDSVSKLATVLRVKEIITIPVMDGITRIEGANTLTLMGIIVNLYDYNVGADKGGAVNLFEDFDIDYNKEKYLIESRCSGALIKPYSAMVLETRRPTTAG